MSHPDDASDLEIIKAFWERIRLKGKKDFYPDYYKLIRAEIKEMEARVNAGSGTDTTPQQG
jgi:hypothetical protein